MRGKVTSPTEKIEIPGITPAYAGKSVEVDYPYDTQTDHPRLCGEKTYLSNEAAMQVGSPPPMRGKGGRCSAAAAWHGITPAYAGKRTGVKRNECTWKDHPRLCGEKIYENEIRVMFGGSPPPMRGKGNQCCDNLNETGITPAYAGKSISKARVSTASRDHPRLCGEKRGRITKVRLMTGSPPPMRGKVVFIFNTI